MCGSTLNDATSTRVPPICSGRANGAGVSLSSDCAAIENSGLENVFGHVLSTDSIKTYKPDPRAYRMAIDAFRLRKNEILFVAFAGWDAAGAKAFGYPTFWTKRLNSPFERLGVIPDAVGKSLNDLVDFVKTAASRSQAAVREYVDAEKKI